MHCKQFLSGRFEQPSDGDVHFVGVVALLAANLDDEFAAGDYRTVIPFNISGLSFVTRRLL